MAISFYPESKQNRYLNGGFKNTHKFKDVQVHHLRNFFQTEGSTLQLFSLIYFVLLKDIFVRHCI